MKNVALPENARLLIVKTSSIGDIIHTFPVVSAIKKERPDVVIDWVVNKPFVELVRLSPLVSDAIAFDRKGLGQWWRPISFIKALGQFKNDLLGKKYDIVLDLQGLAKSAFITHLAKAPVKLGFLEPRERLARMAYNHTIKTPEAPIHAIERNLKALAPLSIEEPERPAYDLVIPEDAKEAARQKLPDGPYIVVNPNGRWNTKRWPQERFAEVIRQIYSSHALPSVIIGSADEKDRGLAIKKLTKNAAIDLTGAGGFSFLAAILRNATGMITNDSGPMHLAAALETKTVALFGPTDPEIVGSYGEGHEKLRTTKDCAPCRRRNCDIAPSCMESISIEQVVAAMGRVIKNRVRQNG